MPSCCGGNRRHGIVTRTANFSPLEWRLGSKFKSTLEKFGEIVYKVGVPKMTDYGELRVGGLVVVKSKDTGKLLIVIAKQYSMLRRYSVYTLVRHTNDVAESKSATKRLLYVNTHLPSVELTHKVYLMPGWKDSANVDNTQECERVLELANARERYPWENEITVDMIREALSITEKPSVVSNNIKALKHKTRGELHSFEESMHKDTRRKKRRTKPGRARTQ